MIKRDFNKNEVGFHVYISFGKPEKFKIHIRKYMNALRICIFYVSIQIGFVDLETHYGNRTRWALNKDDELRELKKSFVR